MARQRPDADRRVRQCEKFARLLRLLRLLLGHGRWNARDLARELGCSVRTLHRDLNVLTMSGVPLRFDRHTEAYCVDERFRFPRFDPVALVPPDQRELQELLSTVRATIPQ